MFCGIKSYNTSSNVVFQHWHRPTIVPPLGFALSIIRSKSAQKSAVQVCRVGTVVMETTQLVLSQFKNFFLS